MASCASEKSTNPRSGPPPAPSYIHFESKEYDLASGAGALMVRVVRADTLGWTPFKLYWSPSGTTASSFGDSLWFSPGDRALLIPLAWENGVSPSPGTELRLVIQEDYPVSLGPPESALIHIVPQSPPLFGHPIHFPLEIGNVWEYDGLRWEVDEGHTSETDRIVGSARFHGKVYAVMQRVTISRGVAQTDSLYLRQENNLLLEVVPSDTSNYFWGKTYPWVAADLLGSAGTTWTPYQDDDDASVQSQSVGPAAILGAGVTYRAWRTTMGTYVNWDGEQYESQSTEMTVEDSVGVVRWDITVGGLLDMVGTWGWGGTAFLHAHHGPGR